MTEIAIDGGIGWDVTSKGLREALDAVSGDVMLTINSPGGVVTEGVAMYNAIRDYRRKKKGAVTARVVGMAASMATYIPMAADMIEIEDNAIWMIHNPWGLAVGDYQDMRKQADILDGLARIMARAYVERTGKDESVIRDLMDSETYLYGEEIANSGFADSVVPAGEGPEDREDAVALAKARLMEAEEKLRQLGGDDREALVALVRELKPGEPPKDDDDGRKSGVAGADTAAKAEKIKEGVMDINTLKMEHPDVFAQAVEIGAKQERDRVTELRTYVDADPANGKVAAVVNEAISSGNTAAQIMARLQVAIRDGGREAGENPGIVATAVDPMQGLDDIDRQAMAAFGLSAEDVRKAKGGK